MNTLRTLALIALLLPAVAAGASAEPAAATGGYDIGALMTEAARVWNFDDQDAVILVESARFSWLPDGRLREEHHRVVWISTDHTLDAFADLRIPWDSDHQTFTRKTLRTWRDQRWINARETAVVETTPSAFRSAPDYTGIRETMLLHDGVELPCILECVYVIEDKAPFRTGMEGQWIFNQDEPALISRVVLEAPGNSALQTAVPEGVTETEAESGLGLVARAYEMRNLAPAPNPAGLDPASYLPHVQWSSYPGWEALGAALKDAYAAGLVLGQTLPDSLDDVIGDRFGDLDRAHAVIDFVSDRQRRIDYDPGFFFNRIRRAERTFDTAYGIDMDMVILAGALLQRAGFEASPAFLGLGYGDLDEGVATLARFGGPGLWVRKDGMEAYYDPSRGALYAGLSPAVRRMLWVPGGERLPRVWNAANEPDLVAAAADLRWNAEEEQWSGEGYYEARGCLSPYDAMEGRGEARERLGKAVAGLVDGLSVDGFSPVRVEPATVAAHLQVSVAGTERDAFERVPMMMGAPAAGLLAAFPPHTDLYLAERSAPVRLAGPLAQTVRLILHLGDLEVVRLPESSVLENAAGRFELSIVREENRVTLTRSLRLAKADYAPDEWPDLRALLLAETYDANRTLLFK